MPSFRTLTTGPGRRKYFSSFIKTIRICIRTVIIWPVFDDNLCWAHVAAFPPSDPNERFPKIRLQVHAAKNNWRTSVGETEQMFVINMRRRTTGATKFVCVYVCVGGGATQKFQRDSGPSRVYISGKFPDLG